jgi:general secretion pathway protein B
MSTILKALQKLEQDKASRHTKEPELSGAIIKAPHRRNAPSAWVLPVSICLVALISILATFTVMGGFTHHILPDEKKSNSTSASNASPHPDSTPAQSAIIQTPEPKPVQSDSASNRRIITSAPPRDNQPTSSPSSLQVISAPQYQTLQSKQTTIAAPTQQTVIDQPSDLQVAPTPATPHLPQLTVSGIAWQKDSASRLAVINGNSVSEGATVEGARIDEIFQDKVRISHNGRFIDLYLGKDHQR